MYKNLIQNMVWLCGEVVSTVRTNSRITDRLLDNCQDTSISILSLWLSNGLFTHLLNPLCTQVFQPFLSVDRSLYSVSTAPTISPTFLNLYKFINNKDCV